MTTNRWTVSLLGVDVHGLLHGVLALRPGQLQRPAFRSSRAFNQTLPHLPFPPHTPHIQVDIVARFNLSRNALGRPLGWTSADAAGLAILPGLVRYEEIVRGYIGERRGRRQTRKLEYGRMRY